ncbi:hypothetical protein AVEN_41650-1 [Araneus ventricosus]|uniref:Uncharacterized protein n=1 Tax=Araneus ventricosus TaxID=182803 RepID=A0A4Y2V5A6_ARAVE|nr:hypothetical protein AVEN_41650-1 [Araneus ventricosus]
MYLCEIILTVLAVGNPEGAPVENTHFSPHDFLSPICLATQKDLFSESPTQRPLVNQPSSEKVLQVYSRTKEKRSNTPREIPRKSEGKGIILPVPLLRRKKMAKRRDVFSQHDKSTRIFLISLLRAEIRIYPDDSM